MAGEDMRCMLLALPKVLLVDYTHYTTLTDDVQRLEGYSVIYDIVIGRCIVISTHPLTMSCRPLIVSCLVVNR